MTPNTPEAAAAPPLLLIGLTGPAGSGKDTAADHLETQHHFARWAFAEPMRTMLEALLVECGLDYAHLFEPALKERPIPGLGFSYRQLAQTLGTEWARTQLAEDFWLRCAGLCTGLASADPAEQQPIHDRIVFTDVRFPNEAAWLRDRGGVIVRVERPGVAPVRAHVSEQHAIEPNFIVWNSGGLEQLQQQLDSVLMLVAGEDTAEVAA